MPTPKIIIFKNKDSINVTATIDLTDGKDNKIRLTSREIESHLKSKNIKFGKCLKSDVLTNGLKSKKLGEWVFENPEKKTTSSKKKTLKKKTAERKISNLDLEEVDKPEALVLSSSFSLVKDEKKDD